METGVQNRAYHRREVSRVGGKCFECSRKKVKGGVFGAWES